MLNRVIYRIHLWTGIAAGLYVLMISISGSAIVARRELIPLLVPQSVAVVGERMPPDRLERAVHEVYADYQVVDIREDLRPVRGSGYGRGPVNPSLARPYHVTLDRDGAISSRLFDPYTGEDLGDEQPWTLMALLWAIDLHADLLAGDTGRTVNGYCGLAFILLSVTGLIIWGVKGRRHLFVRRHIGWRRQIFQLHGALGFWLFVLLILWGVSGVYLAFPLEFSAVLEFFFPTEDDYNERVDKITAWLANMHFGRFGGLGVRWTWIVLGLVPSVLFISGFILWWNSVVKPWRRRVLRAAYLPT